jgi:hypothetical protein
MIHTHIHETITIYEYMCVYVCVYVCLITKVLFALAILYHTIFLSLQIYILKDGIKINWSKNFFRCFHSPCLDSNPRTLDHVAIILPLPYRGAMTISPTAMSIKSNRRINIKTRHSKNDTALQQPAKQH